MSKNKENEKKKREEFRLTCNSQYIQQSSNDVNASQIQTESCKDKKNIRETVEDVDALPTKTEVCCKVLLKAQLDILINFI